ncbi:DUF2971 domain-containing protein [Neptunomonas qingdaonensis]|uniref:DUF2971 domain-containing protein n=1 Tax=Neptunomonas qingdaonensis TaxID=1045558 RepID=A0A1I2LQL2_9GAMM|nr:DUF2971 domain-containing protein [Neptunomonas qingdaonensis]SFF79311.1 Protein of unknown function [Neptunomonas qingdaonensis]
MVSEITQKLYSDIPNETIYHYTSFSGLLGIVGSGSLWASDIRYMNDSAELNHMVTLIREEVNERIVLGHPNPKLLNQFLDWIAGRVTNGHMLFAGSFRANGNLLSQWRGYSELGKGVSIGFDPKQIISCARQQSFMVGKCIYDRKQQRQLIHQIVDFVEDLAAEFCGMHGCRDDIVFAEVFEQVESDLLRIAAILKHPSFQEEEEWRIVSPVVTDFKDPSVHYREGTSMLVPFFEFSLVAPKADKLQIQHIFLGPTPNISLSMNSLSMYLAKEGVAPKRGIGYCQIPYRQR